MGKNRYITDITDIAVLFREYQAKLSELEEQLHSESRIISAMDQRILYLTNENARLEEEKKDLNQRLSSYAHRKDSHNSHLPPSKDIKRKSRSLRVGTGKQSGGQPFHEGHFLEFRDPDRIEEVSPAYCRVCGKDLSGISGEVLEVRQQIDIPIVRPLVTSFHKVRKVCICHQESEGEYSSGIHPGVSYGIGVRSMVCYLSICHHLPYKRLSLLMNEIYGISLSEGTVSNILGRMQQQLFPAYQVIRDRLSLSPVVGVDETPVSVNGKQRWAWVWQNRRMTYVTAGKSREKKNFTHVMPQGMPQTVLVTDCLSSYFSQQVAHHQICTSHLLRELTYLSELYQKHPWSENMAKLIREAIHLRKTNPGEIDFLPFKIKLMELLDAVIDQSYHQIITLQKRLIKYKEFLFFFLENPEVPPDNNASERAIRCFKIKIKVSGFFKSNEGAQRFAQLHSIADTARKNLNSPLDVFRVAASI